MTGHVYQEVAKSTETHTEHRGLAGWASEPSWEHKRPAQRDQNWVCGTVKTSLKDRDIGKQMTVFKPRRCSACHLVTSLIGLPNAGGGKMHLFQELQANKNRKSTITNEVLKHRQFLGRCTSHTLLRRPRSRVGFPVQMHNLALNTPQKARGCLCGLDSQTTAQKGRA